MPARRCGECELKLPHETAFDDCPICGTQTTWLPYAAPSPDWEERVAAVNNREDINSPDPVIRWRLEQLQRGGFSPIEALNLAVQRSVDLHAAIALRAKTDLAFEILI